MFTGIVSDLGQVRRVRRGEIVELTIATAYDTAAIPIGASIACSGACLTVVGIESGAFSVQASAETVATTTIAAWREGTAVNLERPLRLGDELGGHLVSGHVDGIAELLAREDLPEMARLLLRAPFELARFIASKGSVALDGVSLTVNEVEEDRFSVLIIPHTLKVTTLAALRTGAQLNLEVDLMARYAARLLQAPQPSASR
jgi:riboflavin synthase